LLAKQAVVIGAGLAGMMAARVAADHFESVILIERDQVAGPEPRKGVPQGNHIHVLWSVGSAILENLFPGLFDQLAAAGAVGFDNSADMRWYQGGVWKLRMESGLRICSQSRPLLEHKVRQILQTHENVSFQRGSIDQLTIQNLKVCGVKLASSDNLDSEIRTDLVIDASGRGSRLPAWLVEHGYSEPQTIEVGVNLRYASRLYERPEGLDWASMAIYARPPLSKKSGVIFPIEGNRWIVTFGGCFDEHPATDEAGYLDFARSLGKPDIYDAIINAKPVSDISGFQFPKEVWRRYDKLSDLPAGLAVIGDAFCSFNPLYGQGVTVAALEAVALGNCLRSKASLQSYYRSAMKIIRNPWMMATGNDLLYPEASGERAFWTKPMGRYTDHVLRLSASNPTVFKGFLDVLHLAKPPSHLFRPDILAAVLLSPRESNRSD
jgi:2-polyprenyl-6-methoxyphenol hydroxylase-like FAD-dependent oxidoreductase